MNKVQPLNAVEEKIKELANVYSSSHGVSTDWVEAKLRELVEMARKRV